MPLWCAHASSGCVIRYGAARVRTIAGQAYALYLARREVYVIYSKHIISKSDASGGTNASFLAEQRSCPGLSDTVRLALRAAGARRSVDLHSDGELRRCLDGPGYVVSRCNHGERDLAPLQRPANRIDATCNDQREPQETSGYREQSCKTGTRPCLRVAGGRRSDAVRRARSDRARETHK